MSPTKPDEKLEAAQSIVARIASGDRKAEHALVEKYWKGLYFILLRQAQDPELAKDLAQEALIVVIGKAREGKIKNPSTLAAFIRQVGINLLIANFRKETRRKTYFDDSIDVRFPDDSESVHRQLSNKQLNQIVKQVMDELTVTRDKDLLYRYFVYGQEKKQICLEFDISSEHFDRVLYRARNRLKQILQVKLGIDVSKTGLSQLLPLLILVSVGLQTNACFQNQARNIFHSQVREVFACRHLINNLTKDEPIHWSVSSQRYQKEVRWL